VLDDPALDVAVELDQAGSSCLVWSISCCGLNGFPMKACAPREAGVRGRLLVDLAAEHDHRDRADSMPLLDAAQHLPAVDVRHHHVEQDEVGRGLLQHAEPLVGVAGLAHGVALHLEVHPDVLPQAWIVVDDQDDRARARGGVRSGALEEGIEVTAPVAAVAAGRVEGGHAPLVRPLADRALGHAEVLRRLSEGEPIRLAGRGETLRKVAAFHSAANLPKALSLLTGLAGY
jgi:hypothetical protein